MIGIDDKKTEKILGISKDVLKFIVQKLFYYYLI